MRVGHGAIVPALVIVVHGATATASMTEPLGITMSRDGSGTAWQPDSTPIYALHWMPDDWMLMLHGLAFAGYDWQGSDRGDSRFTSMNWVMFMAWHELLGGSFAGRVMLSAEPLTIGHSGYPLLLQTGETKDGLPLHDRQHPHDLFMELAAICAHELGGGLAFQLYLAPVGEPAIGPVAFPHRVSASSMPFAPLGHHWQDSTHVAFGVLTAGLYTRHVKVEGSYFNGREPDENRYDFDLRWPDSLAARVSVNPADSWSLQASYAYLKSPEGHEPDDSLHRVTASAMYDVAVGAEGNLAVTGVWGRNFPSERIATNSFLLEANLLIAGHHNVFGRAEYVDKSGAELVLPPPLETERFHIATLSLGYLFDIVEAAGLVPGVGVVGTGNLVEDALLPFYGANVTGGAMLYARLRFAQAHMMPHTPDIQRNP
jgi:hypothetical protein